jgi:hypothetical protein
MQLFQQPFDAKTVKPNEAFEPVPAGWYVARIGASEAKPTKDNESGYLQLELEVIDGEHKGRRVFDRLNLWNKSMQASEIAQRQLSAYCHATGVMILQDSTQLHGIPIKIKLSVRTQDGYDPSNDVKAVKHIQDVVQGAAPAQPATPFGMAPSLPAMPAPGQAAPQFAPPAFAPPAAPAMPPQPTTQAPPWAGQCGVTPVAAPFAPPQQFAPPAAAPAPQAGPVPPWRK